MEQPDTNKYKVFKKNTTNLPEQRAGRVHCNAPKLVEAPKEDFQIKPKVAKKKMTAPKLEKAKQTATKPVTKSPEPPKKIEYPIGYKPLHEIEANIEKSKGADSWNTKLTTGPKSIKR